MRSFAFRARAASIVVVAVLASSLTHGGEEGCTSALIAPAGSKTGGPVLWKNRDTDFVSNKVVYVHDDPYDYLCLANAENPSGRACWAGLNSAGFGIFNTVAYNLPEKTGEMKDLEGMIMADALRRCGTVADFEAFLNASLGPELGSLANFGVMDADGHSVLFEVHNHGSAKLGAADEARGVLVNTNYARTGAEGKGAGYLRFERASELFGELPPGPVDFRTILTRFTRDTGHVLLRQMTPFQIHLVDGDGKVWVSTRDTIDKAYTSAAVVLVGRRPGATGSVATMWVIPGEPVTAAAVPLWVEAGASPDVLWQGDEAPMWRESLRIKKLARPVEGGNRQDYLDLTALDNADGTGFLPRLLAVERGIIADTSAFLAQQHTAEEYRRFQDEMADRAYQALVVVR